MKNSNRIENSKARLWTKTQLRKTIRQCTDAGLDVKQYTSQGLGTTTIRDLAQDKVVLRSLFTGSHELVRLDSSYFG